MLPAVLPAAICTLIREARGSLVIAFTLYKVTGCLVHLYVATPVVLSAGIAACLAMGTVSVNIPIA